MALQGNACETFLIKDIFVFRHKEFSARYHLRTYSKLLLSLTTFPSWQEISIQVTIFIKSILMPDSSGSFPELWKISIKPSFQRHCSVSEQGFTERERVIRKPSSLKKASKQKKTLLSHLIHEEKLFINASFKSELRDFHFLRNRLQYS